MVNPLALLGGAGLAKRATNFDFTSVKATTLGTWAASPITTSLTVYGSYDGTSTFSTWYTTRTTTYNSTSIAWPVAPLTTVFTPKPDCSSNWNAYGWDSSYAVASFPSFVLPQWERPDCWPQDWLVVDSYSPGICPSGFNIVKQEVILSTKGASVVSEHSGFCCAT